MNVQACYSMVQHRQVTWQQPQMPDWGHGLTIITTLSH